MPRQGANPSWRRQARSTPICPSRQQRELWPSVAIEARRSGLPLRLDVVAGEVALETRAHALRRQAVLGELVFMAAELALGVVVEPGLHAGLRLGRESAHPVGVEPCPGVGRL